MKELSEYKRQFKEYVDKYNKGLKINVDKYKKEFKKYMNNYKEELKKCIEDLKHKETFYKQIPNLLTVSRPLGMIPVNILLFTGNVVPAMILLGCLFMTDFFDGKIARKYNIVSKFGADLDAVCDKIMFLGLALPLLINNPILGITVLLEAGIAFVNVLGRLEGLDTKTVYSGKIKTWLVSFTLGFGYLNYLFGLSSELLRWLVMITAGGETVSLTEYIKKYKELKKDKEEKNDVPKKEIIFEQLDDKAQDRLLEILEKETKYVLSTPEPGKVYTGKKRVRKKMEERKII